MALKRETILQAFKTALQAITTDTGFNYSVRTVLIGRHLASDFNTSDYPLVEIIGSLPDREDRFETFGGNSSNNLKRNWPLEVIAYYAAEGQDARIVGEHLLDDLIKRIIKDTRANTLKDAGADFVHLGSIQGATDFQAREYHLSEVHVIFNVVFNFTPGGL